jgi:hypothetical protein
MQKLFLTLVAVALAGLAFAQVGGGGISAGGGGASVVTGTFELTWPDICTTTPSQTWNYVMIGSSVTAVMVDTVGCTSDTATFVSAADWPLALRPARNTIFWGVSPTDNTVQDNVGCFLLATSGTVSVIRSTALNQPCTSTTWTAAGVKGVAGIAGNPQAYSYSLN